MSLFYIDTSAALKLLVEETASTAFARFYDDRTNDWWVSSALLRIEVMRAVMRAVPAADRDARELLLAFDYVDIDDEIVDAAAGEPDWMLRSLDAIHIATARVFGENLTALVTYDERMAAAAGNAGIPVASPRDVAGQGSGGA